MHHSLKGSVFSGEKSPRNQETQNLRSQDIKAICDLIQLIRSLFPTMLVLRNYLRVLKKFASLSKLLKNLSDRWLLGFQPWVTSLSLPPHSSVSLRNLLERWLWFPGKLPAFDYLWKRQ